MIWNTILVASSVHLIHDLFKMEVEQTKKSFLFLIILLGLIIIQIDRLWFIQQLVTLDWWTDCAKIDANAHTEIRREQHSDGFTCYFIIQLYINCKIERW